MVQRGESARKEIIKLLEQRKERAVSWLGWWQGKWREEARFGCMLEVELLEIAGGLWQTEF